MEDGNEQQARRCECLMKPLSHPEAACLPPPLPRRAPRALPHSERAYGIPPLRQRGRMEFPHSERAYGIPPLREGVPLRESVRNYPTQRGRTEFPHSERAYGIPPGDPASTTLMADGRG